MKMVSLFGMALLYVIAGIFHLIHPEFYLRIMPPWLPWHSELVFVTGVIEILLGLLLLLKKSRGIAAWLIIIFLIAVFPANIQMAINYYNIKSPNLWIAIVRLPLQFLFIWWAWQYTDSRRNKTD